MRALAIVRVMLGFLLAPHAGIPVLVLFACADTSGPFLRCVADSGDLLRFFAALVAVCGYPPMLVLGVPLLFLLRRHGLLRPVPLSGVGIAISLIAAGVFFLVEEKYSVAGMLQWIPFAMRMGVPVAGVVAGLAFWAIALAGDRALALRRAK
jgi:hypothetical protein